MLNQKLMWVVWPAFLAACVLELVVFALVDPNDLAWGGHPIGLSRQATYTAGFFVFWAISMVASGLTALLGMPPAEVNLCPFSADERPDGCPQR